jgi:hypothetical protein
MPNVYFLVEGRRTEIKLYPKWIPALSPKMIRVDSLSQVVKDNFYMFSGQGYPSLLHNHLINSIKDVNNHGSIDYLVICLDSDDSSVEQRRQEVIDFVNQEKVKLNVSTQLVIIVQHRCIETWLLGNKKILKRNPVSQCLRDYISYYNVSVDDPELMRKIKDFNTSAQFHEAYLSEIFAERNISYTKKNPGIAGEQTYLKQLVKRVGDDNHIVSFKSFIDFCVAL